MITKILLYILPLTSNVNKATKIYDDSTIVAAIIAVIGIIIGSILTLISQIVLKNFENKREKKKKIYEEQLNIYPQVLEYIFFYAQLQKKIKNNEDVHKISEMQKEEERFYSKFYYVFSLISNDETIYKFNELKQNIKDKNIDPKDAYEQLLIILKTEKN